MDFDTASLVFDDPNCATAFDRRVDGEDRWHTVGMVGNRLLVVVHTTREENHDGEDLEIIRIISARAATPKERRAYEG